MPRITQSGHDEDHVGGTEDAGDSGNSERTSRAGRSGHHGGDADLDGRRDQSATSPPQPGQRVVGWVRSDLVAQTFGHHGEVIQVEGDSPTANTRLLSADQPFANPR